MKKTLKIVGYVLLSLFLLTMILVVTASLSQKKIVDIVLNKISESATVPIEIDDLSFTLIKRFPYATFEFSGVKIGAEQKSDSTSQSQEEDILNIKSVYVSVKTMPLIRGEYEIIKVEIDGAKMNYNIDSLGYSNIDFLLNSNAKDSALVDTSTSLPTLNLKKVKLKNTEILYVDNKLQAAANLFSSAIDIAGKFENENFNGSIEGDLQLTKCTYASTNLNQMEKATFDFKLNYQADSLQIKSLEAKTDGAQIGIIGIASFTKDLFVDLNVETEELDLKKLVKYAPNELLNEFGIGEVEGMMQVSGKVKGNVSDSIIPFVNLDVILTDGNAKTKDYPDIRKLNFEGQISNGSEQNNKTSSAIFKSIHAETDSSMIDMSLSLRNLDKPEYTLNSKLNIHLEEFKNLIPDTLLQHISGAILAEISTKGIVPDSIDDNFINQLANNSSAKLDFTNFNIDRDSLIVNDFSASIIYNPRQLEVNNLNISIPAYKIGLTNSSFVAAFTGPVSPYQNLDIDFKSLYVEAPQGNIRGSAKIKNPARPDFIIDASVMINLAEIKPFIPDSLISKISGNLAAEISTRGTFNLDSVAEQMNDIIFKQSKFTLEAKNISATMPDTLQKITDLTGVVKLENDRILISQMKGLAADIGFSIDSATIANIYNAAITNRGDTILISKTNGVAAGVEFSIDSVSIVNIYNAVIMNQHETVLATGNFNFGAIDYSILAPFFTADSTENVNTKKEKTNDNTDRNYLFEFKGKMAAKSFKYEKILLENLSAKFNVSDSVYIIDQFKTNAFGGSSNSSVRFSTTADGKQIVNVKNLVDRMDITQFLYAFDNFGQDSIISYENISGLASAELHSRIVFDADTIVSDDMRVMGDLKLENGRLINYQPAMDVANFTGIKELDNIDLKTLNSNIFMFKNKMYVPMTNVVSTSMDFSAYGMQSLGDNFEYHLQMNLGEVLKGKSKKLLEKQSESGDEISKEDIDRNTIKLIYSYEDGKSKTGFDNKKAQKSMELKIQVQQKMLELIFHPKLVSFETGVQ